MFLFFRNNPLRPEEQNLSSQRISEPMSSWVLSTRLTQKSNRVEVDGFCGAAGSSAAVGVYSEE